MSFQNDFGIILYIMSDCESDNEIKLLSLPLSSNERKIKRRQYNTEWKRKSRKCLKLQLQAHDAFHPVVEDSSEDDENLRCIDTTAKVTNESQLLDNDDVFIDMIDRHETTSDSYLHNSDESDSSESCSSEQEIDKTTLQSDLAKFVECSNLLTTQTDALLAVLNKHKDVILDDLPKTHKGLFRVSRNSIKNEIRELSGHQYYYVGLEKQLRFYLPRLPTGSISSLELIWNVDGLQIFKSKRLTSWPILCYISNIRPRKVFEVAITLGSGKPTNLDFLTEFVDELKCLMLSGLSVENKRYEIKMKACVADAPARAMIKNIKQFSAKHGCDMCIKDGVHDGKRTVFVGTGDCTLRTDDSFRQRGQPSHHKDISFSYPVESLPVDMIKCFPPDFMHQCGGTMKKILLWILSGPRRSCNHRHLVRMAPSKVALLNKRIQYINRSLPNMFGRRARTTDEVNNYKYSELRQFLLYTGKLLFMDLMASEEQYKHFIVYSSVCCLMSDPLNTSTCLSKRQALLKDVVDGFSELYGEPFMTYNAHSNLHFADVVEWHGDLSSVSAFPFENHFRHMKKYITSSHNALISMVKGIQRRQSSEKSNIFDVPKTRLFFDAPNNVYVDRNHHRCYEAVAKTSNNNIKLIEYMRKEPLFTDPVNSFDIGCYTVNLSSWRYVFFDEKEVEALRRGICINLELMPGMESLRKNKGKVVIMASLHDEENNLF